MKKGIAIPIGEVFNALAIIGVLIMIIYIWKGRYFDIAILVQTEEDQRRIVTLGQILLSHPRLVTFEDDRALRDVLDPTKLDDLVSDSTILYQEVNYPNSTYSFMITDLDTNAVWPVTPGTITAEIEYKRIFPLAVKYSDSQINQGIMELKYYVNQSS